MWIRLEGEGTLTARLVRGLREAIRSGRLGAGARAPSSRALAADLGLSRVTVVRAFDQLLAEGYLESRRGSGTFVASRTAAAGVAVPAARGGEPARHRSAFGRRLAGPGRPLFRGWLSRSPLPFDFRYGMPSLRDFPLASWQRTLGRTLRGASMRAHDYGPPEGAAPLRAALAARLGRARGIVCAPEQIVVVSGSQQALDLLARLLLCEGDTALVEEPGYEGARNAFLAAGARLAFAPVDAEGLDASGIPARRLRLAHVTPGHQYPLGSVLSLPRRQALLALAARHGAVVIEDDYDGEFRYEGAPLETLFTLDGGRRVVHVATFSKILFPALRLGYAVLPPDLVEPFARAKLLADGGSPMLEQLALARFLESGDLDRHVRRARLRNRERRETLVAAIREALGDDAQIEGANAGLHLVCWLPRLPPRQLGAVARAAAERGVGVYPISPYYAEPPPVAGFVLGYAGLRPEDLREGVARLTAVLEPRLAPRAGSGRASTARAGRLRSSGSVRAQGDET